MNKIVNKVTKLISNTYGNRFVVHNEKIYGIYPKIDYTKLVGKDKKIYGIYPKIDYTKLVAEDKKYTNAICIYTLDPCKNPTKCKKNKICESLCEFI